MGGANARWSFHFPKSSSKNAVIAHPLQFSVSFQGQMVKEGIKREEEKRESNLTMNVNISQGA